MKRPHEMVNPISKLPFFHIRGKEKGRGMKNHQGIPLFNPPFFYNRPMIDRRKSSTQKTEDRKAIRKSARRTFLSLTTWSEQHPRKWEGQGADAWFIGWTYLDTPLIGFSVFLLPDFIWFQKPVKSAVLFFSAHLLRFYRSFLVC